MSKPSDLGSLKIGSYILLPHTDQPSGEACRIIEYDTSKPGKHGAAKARIVGQGIFDGKNRPHVGPVSMQIHIPMINKKVGQIISINGDTVQVMDSETFETIDIAMIDESVEGKLENGQKKKLLVMEHTKIYHVNVRLIILPKYFHLFNYKNNYIFILIIALKSLTFTNTVDADDCWKSRLICDDDYEY